MTMTVQQLIDSLITMGNNDNSVLDMEVQIRVYAAPPQELRVTDEERMVEDGEYLNFANDDSIAVENGKLTLIGDKWWD